MNIATAIQIRTGIVITCVIGIGWRVLRIGAIAIQIRTGIVITCVIGIGVISVLDGRTTPTVTLEQRPAAVTSTTAPSAPTTTTEAPTTTTTTKHIVRKSVTRSAAPAGMAATTTPNMPPEPIEQQHNIPDCPDYCVELEVTQ